MGARVGLIDELLSNNADFDGTEVGALPVPPSRQLTVITCMDSRIDVFEMLGLRIGEAHILRNAGGIVTEDVLRSLTISQRKLNTREVAIIQHTGCGIGTFSDADFDRELWNVTGARPQWRAQTFTDIDESVRESMRRVRTDPFVAHVDSVRGFVLEIVSGRLREVE